MPAFSVTSFYDFQLASKHFGKKVTIAAGGLKETTVYTGTFISNEIAHALTSRSAVKTSPCAATRCFDLTWRDVAIGPTPIPQKLYFEVRRGKGAICCPARFDRDYFLA